MAEQENQVIKLIEEGEEFEAVPLEDLPRAEPVNPLGYTAAQKVQNAEWKRLICQAQPDLPEFLADLAIDYYNITGEEELQRQIDSDSLVSSHTMFLDSRASDVQRDRLQVNCLAHAEPGCQLRMTLVEFTCPNADILSLAEFPDGSLGVSTLYLHADGVSLTNKEVGALGAVGGDDEPNPQLFTSNVLAKVPVRRDNPPAFVQFYPPSERSCTAILPNSVIGVFTLRLTDSRGNSLSTVTGLEDVFGVNGAGFFSCAIRIDVVRVAPNDGGGLHEAPNPLPDRETCLSFLHTVDRPEQDLQRQFHS